MKHLTLETRFNIRRRFLRQKYRLGKFGKSIRRFCIILIIILQHILWWGVAILEDEIFQEACPVAQIVALVVPGQLEDIMDEFFSLRFVG